MICQEYNINIKYFTIFAHTLSPIQEDQGVTASTKYVYCMILLAEESILLALCLHTSLSLVIKSIEKSQSSVF